MAGRSRRRILVVDDEADIRTSLRNLLEDEVAGVDVVTADGGPAALALLEQAEFHLILCDYRMPGMDGLSFLERARRRRPDIPVVMITAYPDPVLAARAVRELGVGLFVAKPMDLDYLVGLVHAVVRGEVGRRVGVQP